MSKIKNPFKSKSIMDTLTNTAIGGAGNVAFDYVWDAAGLDATFADKDGKTSPMIKNAIKLVGGAIAGSMVSNRYLRAMTDGFSVVGASNLVSELITSSDDTTTTKTPAPGGLPSGTIGRIRRHYGSGEYARRTRGTNGLEGFMG